MTTPISTSVLPPTNACPRAGWAGQVATRVPGGFSVHPRSLGYGNWSAASLAAAHPMTLQEA